MLGAMFSARVQFSARYTTIVSTDRMLPANISAQQCAQEWTRRGGHSFRYRAPAGQHQIRVSFQRHTGSVRTRCFV